MNLSHRFLLVICGAAFALLSFLHLHGQQPAAPAIVVVDVQQALKELAEMTAIQADITTMNEKLQEEAKARQKEINDLGVEIKVLQESTPQHEQALEKMAMKQLEFKAWSEYNQRRLEREKTLKVEEVYRKLNDAIARIAKKNNIDLVFFKDDLDNVRASNQQTLAAMIQTRKVLYSSERLDVTAQTVQLLNNEFKNRKPAP